MRYSKINFENFNILGVDFFIGAIFLFNKYYVLNILQI